MNDHDGTPLIEAYRARVIPSRRAEDEILARLQRVHRTRAAVWTISAALALAAALLAVWFGTLGDRLATRAKASQDEAVHGIPTPPGHTAVPGVRAKEHVPEPALLPPVGPAPSATITEPSTARPSSRPRTSVTSPSPSQDIAAEAALVAEAQAALRDRDPARASLALDAYARRFPDGAMLRDARALRVIVECSAGRAAAVATDARAFLDDPTNAAFAARIRHVCGL